MIPLNELKDRFDKLKHLSKHERMVHVCGLLAAYFQKDNIQPIIVGGLSVEIYTRNNYTTYDIDLVTDGRDQFDKLLTNELGFTKEGRSWYHEELEISIEIPDNYLEGSKDKVIEMELENELVIYVIGVEDIIIHRLESAIVSHPKTLSGLMIMIGLSVCIKSINTTGK
ncbi:DUF6036 family nucleotidyltransferase [Oceanobacillus damuensis]|uniref:DUF6036 family nucleotidyltransferase n=1 Tax=Oceanobacillus damuensis TaxID=937928 RepID=UPI00082BE2A0|nr:DUF6036 family nucleotidyltransferase [Oceanobacillus damuensis]